MLIFQKFIDEQLAGSCKFEQMTPIVRSDDEQEIAIAKQFTFSSSVLRMSVICKSLNQDHMDVYTKGAPEKIVELCLPETGKYQAIK
jgi:magnesium-transporting ATPase (P-type)